MKFCGIPTAAAGVIVLLLVVSSLSRGVLANHIGRHPSVLHNSLKRAFAKTHHHVKKAMTGRRTTDLIESLAEKSVLASKKKSCDGDSSANEGIGRWGYVNVRAFGAIADGQTDDTPAFQAALNTASAADGGSRVFVPAGTYMLNGSLTIPPYTVLEGVNSYPFSSFQGGSILKTNSGMGNASAAPFVFMQGPDAGIKGLTITYLNQEGPEITEYPPCIQGNGDNLSVLDMLLGNPYFGIDFGTFPCGRHLISNVYGQPISTGIYVNQIYDIGRIRHVHFWPFYSPQLVDYIFTHGTTFHIQRSDWQVVIDVFSWGYNIGMLFDESSSGGCNGQFTDVNFDDVNQGIVVKYLWPNGIQFSNLNLANGGNGHIKTAVWCPTPSSGGGNGMAHWPGGQGLVVIRGLVIWGQWHHAIHWQCPQGQIGVSDSVFYQWNSTYSAIEGELGRLSITNNYFNDSIGTAIHLHDAVDRAIVMGNDLIGNKLICNGAHTLCKDNLP